MPSMLMHLERHVFLSTEIKKPASKGC